MSELPQVTSFPPLKPSTPPGRAEPSSALVIPPRGGTFPPRPVQVWPCAGVAEDQQVITAWAL